MQKAGPKTRLSVEDVTLRSARGMRVGTTVSRPRWKDHRGPAAAPRDMVMGRDGPFESIVPWEPGRGTSRRPHFRYKRLLAPVDPEQNVGC